MRSIFAFVTFGLSWYTLVSSQRRYSSPPGSLTKLYIRQDGFTITSMRQNLPGSNASDWVENIFGEKAVHRRDLQSQDYDIENIKSSSSFREGFQLPLSAIQPACSIEILGFAKLGREEPFMKSNREQLIVGNASMVLGSSSEQWSCYYRPGFERWRTAQHYWSVFLYCPAPNADSCNYRNSTKGSLRGKLTMQLESTYTESQFMANNFLPDAENKGFRLPSIPSLPTMAVCLAIPYTTSDPEKVKINGAILFEWVQYYSLLGYKVLIYDKGAANREYIYQSPYGNAQGLKGSRWRRNVVYHPNTILGLLDKYRKIEKYDNTEKTNADIASKRSGISITSIVTREKYLDDDKTSTLTQCRFEASAVYGIDTVLVADFDEFLFCPNAASTFGSQRIWIDNLLLKYRQNNVDSLVFLQVWTAARLRAGNYSAPLDCLTDKVKRKESIFSCFAGIDFPVRNFHTGKSIHIGHKCPLTDFHSSCASSDCACTISYPGSHHIFQSTPKADRCFFMHLSTNPSDYTKRTFSNRTQNIIESTPSELFHMVRRVPLK